jgi:hypothetical protein
MMNLSVKHNTFDKMNHKKDFVQETHYCHIAKLKTKLEIG